MHEYSLMENVIGNILLALKGHPLTEGEKIKEVSLKVGALEIHSEESFRQAFGMLAQNTPLAKCRLRLTLEPGRLKCERCGYDGLCPLGQGDCHDAIPIAPCPSCEAPLPIQGGRGIQAIDLVTDRSS